ncbi:transglutaminase family protein [Bremerella alba]|uniref:Transglutaminase-like domain-containing protein n=1 Tax=Bremerella alba TaxID=980252 RepID=A0A7V8V2U0_9BACT|nr:transglutaminase family protein [Bremerella alba]MBA2113892.1 hypothetical protein [Bremerella alba]
MAILTAIHHSTKYKYDRKISVGAQTIRLRPAPHCRTPIHSYSLKISPQPHFLNWQQDPHGNFAARVVFPEPVDFFQVDVDLTAEMTVINPFDFFLEPDSEEYPIVYQEPLKTDLAPFLELEPPGPLLTEYLKGVDITPRRTVDFLVDINQRLQDDIKYTVRMEHGVQSAEQTLEKRLGSCRDSAWLLVQMLRHFGLAARFASGYICQLKPDIKSLDGPSGTEVDFTDLHAWTEVFLPGAGWVGLDPTSGLFAGEGHIPLACTPSPITAAPVSGSHEKAEVEFDFDMTITRFHEDPRVTKPYTDDEWQEIQSLGHEVDKHLDRVGITMTMGGEPTFVSIDDMEGDEWNTAAVGPTKRGLADKLMRKLFKRFGDGGFLHYGQGKWYPGESLPRWAFRCYWRYDGEPIWKDASLLAEDGVNYGHDTDLAMQFTRRLAEHLGVEPNHSSYAYEDAFYYTWMERRLPVNVDIHDSKLEDEEERSRIAKVFEQGITSPVGVVLPLRYLWWTAQPGWESGEWVVRSDELFLIPGDSAMGLRLPLKSLFYEAEGQAAALFPLDPMAVSAPLPSYAEFMSRRTPAMVGGDSGKPWSIKTSGGDDFRSASRPQGMAGQSLESDGFFGPGDWSDNGGPNPMNQFVRTAICVEPRGGCLHVFMPPLDRLEGYLELLSIVESVATELSSPVIIEGYLPPEDDRVNNLSVTPDPGVIEVNVQPANNWQELVDITTGVYEDAHHTRLGTEKFNKDGTHTGTGGGNHVVLGGPTPAQSPFLQRPDILRSLIGYWHNHPSLSYLFSGNFIGPTSQAPRIDEGRGDAIYELKIAFEQIPDKGHFSPWLVDRVFRNLLVDITGNTHRAEFCIDKLFSPDSSSGRRGLLEFRAFEMPPHAQMSLTQQLLLRSLMARFAEHPYKADLVDWDTSLHDRFMLPHFNYQDFEDVIDETKEAGFQLESKWFLPHFEFKFPKIGDFAHRGVKVELRKAIEPWYVLGEESGQGFTARYVDSSLERMQVKVNGAIAGRHYLMCNGRRIPLHPTGTEQQFVAGVRYRAWQPPSCLHPTIPVDEPLTIDLYDAWAERSLGGCRYHVGHPGGNNPESFPVNAFEAESRRGGRFEKMGHTPGHVELPPDETSSEFPFTLDLRRGKTKHL